MVNETSISQWLASLAARTPTPGGGAAAALSAATSAALIGMVANYTTGSKWADREQRMTELVAEAEQLRAEALGLADADEQAFAQVGAAYGLPRGSDEEKQARTAAIQQALVGAAAPPSAIAKLCTRLVAITAELAGTGNPNVISDVAVAASNAHSALQAAIVNIEINAASIKDEQVSVSLRDLVKECESTLHDANEVVQRVRESISS